MFQLKIYGAAKSVAVWVPSINNSTLVTPVLSAALAVTLIVPLTVEPEVGAVMDVVGGVVSVGGGGGDGGDASVLLFNWGK